MKLEYTLFTVFLVVLFGYVLLNLDFDEIFTPRHISVFFAKLAGFGLGGWGSRR
jgi:hypothetical protein